MEFKLFLDNLDRDVFVSKDQQSSKGNFAPWKMIYKDMPSYMTAPENEIKIIKNGSSTQLCTFLWQSKVYARREKFGGLVIDVTKNQVFKLDMDAYELMKLVLDGDDVISIPDNVAEIDFRHFLALLEKLDLIRQTNS